jgi:hypothetical protein
MMGKLTQSVPKPEAETSITEAALNLLVVMGGDNKPALKLLKDLKKAHDNNERVLAEAKEAIAESERLDKEIAAKQSNLSHAMKKAEAELEKRNNALIEQETAFSARKLAFDEDVSARKAEIGRLRAGIEAKRGGH